MKPIIIAGPCVIESEETMHQIAEHLVGLNVLHGIDIIYRY